MKYGWLAAAWVVVGCAGGSAVGVHTKDCGTEPCLPVAPATNGAAAGSAPTTDQWVVGYYVGYQIDRYKLEDIDWSGLTHIAFSPLSVRADGSLDTTFMGFGTPSEGADFARKLASAAHAHGVKALLMLGGAGISDHFKPALSADKAGFIARLLEATRELGYDGLDIDIEAKNFTLDDYISLASGLRAADPALVLIASGASASLSYGVAPDARLPELVKHVDRYFLQTYQGGSHGMFTGGDSAGGRFESWFYSALGGASPLRPFSIDYALSALANAGIPKKKIGMGIAFYAACYFVPDTTPPGGRDVDGPRMPTNAPSEWCWDCGVGGGDNRGSYNDFYRADGLLGKSTATEQKRDSEAQMPYLSFATEKQDATCGGSTRYVTYEDEASIIAKGNYSRSNGYGGTILWTLQQGYLPENAAGGRARNALMQALRKGFIAP
jgi:chitinase